MAKGSFNGVIRGKKGNTVFYKLANSNNKEKQGWREYSATIANPQTDGQIDQRVKMQAVNNLYRALKSVITRGFENHKYGDESRRAWLKLALGRTFAGPYIEKGSTLAIPIEGVPIMYGSLAPVVVEDNGSGDCLFNNVVGESVGAVNTIGDLSSAFIFSGLAQEGDQVTFVIAKYNNISVNYDVRSFYVDANDTSLCSDILGVAPGLISFEDENHLLFPLGTELYAFACSISRDGDGQHLRSTSEFMMTAEFKAALYGNAAQQAAAKASYKKTSSASTNWQQVPGGEGGVTPGEGQEAVTNAGVTRYVTALTSTGTGNNYRLLMPGSLYVRGVIREGSSDTVVFLCANGVTSQQAPADATNANTVNACSTTNVVNGLRQWLIDNGVAANQLVID